ncbi:UNVERIFIED_ORG: uncharacterized protein HemY [Variovorax guangxiensis]
MQLKERVSGVVGSAKAKAVAVAVIALAAASSASAAVVDVSDVVTEIKAYTGATSPIVLIGGAILLVIIAVAAFRWIRSAMR